MQFKSYYWRSHISMVFEPLYLALKIRVSVCVIFFGCFLFLLVSISMFFICGGGAIFNKQ